jgi:hypothetical protein
MSALPLDKEAIEANKLIAERTNKFESALDKALSVVEQLSFIAAANQNKEKGGRF